MQCGLRLRLKYTAAGVLCTVTVPLYMYVNLLLIATLVENRILCQSNNPIITGMHIAHVGNGHLKAGLLYIKPLFCWLPLAMQGIYSFYQLQFNYIGVVKK